MLSPSPSVRRRHRLARLLGTGLLVAAVIGVVPTPSFAIEPVVRIDESPLALTPVAPPLSTRSAPLTLDDPWSDASDHGDPEPDDSTHDESEHDESEHDESSPAGRAEIAGRPGRLRGLAIGVEDFSLIGVSLRTTSGEPALVRVHTPDGWGDWLTLDIDGDHAPDADSAEAQAAAVPDGVKVSEPAWIRQADGYELNLPADASGAIAHLARESTRRVIVQNGAEPAGATTVPLVGTPPIKTRAAWGARPAKNFYGMAPRVRLAVVHHSVTANDYGPADVPAILRSIQAFHMDSQGWNDIAYNFAVDKWGGIWEGRGGGITNAVLGGHALGANYQTTGVVALGDFTSVPPTTALIDSIGELLGWKLFVHGVDPSATTSYVTGATGTFAAGTRVTWPTIVGHRDTGPTGCPGNLLHPQLGAIRARAAATYARLRGTPGLIPAPTIGTNADGRAEVFAITNDQQLVHSWETGGGAWSGWAPMGGRVIGRPTVISNRDGRLEVFAIGVGGHLLHAWQVAPNSPWTGLFSLGGSFSPDIGVAVGRNPDGRLEVFAVDDDDTVSHSWQARTPSGWSGYFSLGGSFPSTSELRVATNKDGRLEVFAIGDDASVQHSFQWATPTGWSGMQSMGGRFASGLSVGTNSDGRLELFAISTSGQLEHLWQTKPGGAWSGIAPLGATATSGSGTAVGTNADGRLEVFVIQGDQLSHAWQSGAGTGWDAVIPLGGRAVGIPGAGRTGDGRLVVATIDPTRPTRAWVNTQITAGSGWGSWRTIA